MKNKLLITMMLVFAVTVMLNVNLAAGSLENACYPTIKLVNQDPYPATPGSYVKVLFSISGLENPFCKGMSVRLEPEFPFSLNPGENGIRSIGGSTFSSGSISSWNIPFRLQISPDAFEGDYKLKLTYRMDTNEKSDNFDAQQSFIISITDALTDFDTVVQGVTGQQMSLGLVNIGKNTANSLVVTVPQQENFRTADINQQIIGNLAVGDYTIVSFNIMPKNMGNSGVNGSMNGEVNVSRNRQQRMGENSSGINNYNNNNYGLAGGFTPFNQQQNLTVKIDYTDGIGKRRSVLREIPVTTSLLVGNNSGRGQGQAKPNNTGLVSYISGWSDWQFIGAIGILLVIGAYVGYKRGKNSRKAIVCEEKPTVESRLGKLPKMFNTDKNQTKK